MKKKRYVQVGLGNRARFFYQAVAKDFGDTSEIVAFCDVNQTRMDYANSLLKEIGVAPVKTYKAEDFEKMIEEQKPDYVIVTSIDRTHDKYIIRAMELGCDVISEKPMTTDEVKAKNILDAIERTGKSLRVTFNYRYAPHNSKIRELIMDGAIGKVNSVHFEWLLNTKHGADYFRRWHRDKRNSGGLLVHKSTHHFDLINFWLGTSPKTVYAMGDLMFYGKANAEERGVTKFYHRGTGQSNAEGDPFALDLSSNEFFTKAFLEAEHEDGYLRDKSVFDDGISIEDTMGAIVKYNSGAILTYSLNTYMPWEGFRVAFNGDKGRIQMSVVENTYISGGGQSSSEGSVEGVQITVFPMFGEPYDVEIEKGEGGHGGGDPILLNDIFGVPVEDRLERAASHIDGVRSILTGIAAEKSIATGMPIAIDDLLKL